VNKYYSLIKALKYILNKQMKGGVNMLGFAGVSVFLAYLFCILITIVCIIYGAVMWNKDK
jgi:hypothetical protein